MLFTKPTILLQQHSKTKSIQLQSTTAPCRKHHTLSTGIVWQVRSIVHDMLGSAQTITQTALLHAFHVLDIFGIPPIIVQYLWYLEMPTNTEHANMRFQITRLSVVSVSIRSVIANDFLISLQMQWINKRDEILDIFMGTTDIFLVDYRRCRYTDEGQFCKDFQVYLQSPAVHRYDASERSLHVPVFVRQTLLRRMLGTISAARTIRNCNVVNQPDPNPA